MVRQAALSLGPILSLSGAVPAGVVASVHGAHLHKQATEDIQGPSADVAPPIPTAAVPPGDPPALIEEKRSQRAAAIEWRHAAAALWPPEVAGAAVRDRFLAALRLQPGVPVSGYWPQPDELDCRPLLLALHRAGHPIGLPVIAGRGQPLDFRRWEPERPLVPGTWGIAVPPPDAPPLRPGLVLAPLLAFDAAGYRLGYGGGFYDRTLERLAAGGDVAAVGVGYAAQQVAAVPRGPHDRRLDWIITERAALRVA